MMTTKWLARGAAGVALIAAITACSSSHQRGASSSPRTSPVSGSAAPASSTASPIKVGLICSCTGPYGANDIAPADVARAWAKSVNASGGLEGHSIDLKVLDDASSPGTSATDAQTLISDHVAAIIDISNFEATWESAVTAAKIPVVGGDFDSAMYGVNPDFYPTGTTIDASLYTVAATAKASGATSLGFMYCAEAAICSQQVASLKAAGAQVHVPLNYETSIAVTAPNYTAQCVAAQQKKVEAIDVADSEAIIARVAGDCDRQGYDPTYDVVGIAYTPALPTAPGVKKLWMPFDTMPIWSDAREVQAMNAVVDKYYPGLRSSNGGVIWSQYAAQAWTAGLLIRDAVKGSGVSPSGTISSATMTQGLDSIKNDTLDGWSPPLTFNAGQPHKVDCWFTAKWTNGTPSLIKNGGLSCLNGSAS